MRDFFLFLFQLIGQLFIIRENYIWIGYSIKSNKMKNIEVYQFQSFYFLCRAVLKKYPRSGSIDDLYEIVTEEENPEVCIKPDKTSVCEGTQWCHLESSGK